MWDDSNRPVSDPKPQNPVTVPQNHQVDFLQAIVENRKPTADIAIGHDSVALIHLANIAVRTGRSLQVDPGQETIKDDQTANAMLSRSYRDGGHWSVPTGAG